MSSVVSRITNLTHNYLWGIVGRKDTAARFWYLPERAAVNDADSLTRYLACACPVYLMDYREKLKYNLKNRQGIIVLDYGHSIGRQINPEAAFQYALALCDRYLMTSQMEFRQNFFHYADFFLDFQDENGAWNYQFDWFESESPWSSALAQARGASVMLRAWLLSRQEQYRQSALKALELFTLPIEQGGYLARFPLEPVDYFEEYPKSPHCVLNGFMACILGLFEVKTWLHEYENLFQQALCSLEHLLPHFTLPNWTCYDLDERNGMKNYNSPRYHQLIISYLSIISAFDKAPVFSSYLKTWESQQRVKNKAIATVKKLKRKLMYK